MTRREMFERMGKSAIAGGLAAIPAGAATATPENVSASAPAQLAGTEPLTTPGDMGMQMVDGIHRYLIQQTQAAPESRRARWNPDYSSHAAYAASIDPHRERFRQIVGLIDQRVPFSAPSIEATVGGASIVATGAGFKVSSVRWPVLEGVDAEGLLLQPTGTPVARVVALPDADWTPEMLVGITPGVPAEAQFARRLAENGCLVMVPTLIDRDDRWSGNPQLGKLTNETHREYIHRMAFDMGRHTIGYEVQKVLAAVDWLAQGQPPRPVGVMGYGEGALLALYSAAADSRIDAACVSGYFQSREESWQEPIYRSIWSLLTEFGDAELAGMIAPRTLVIEAARGVEIGGPPPATKERPAGASPGRLVSPQLADVQKEVDRAKPVFEKLAATGQLDLVVSGDGQGAPGSDAALHSFLRGLGVHAGVKASGPAPRDLHVGVDPAERQHRQFQQLRAFTLRMVMESEAVREKFWARADASSIEKWKASTAFYRDYFWQEIIGKLPAPSLPLAAQTRKIYDEVNWTGYEVMLPLWPDVYAYGILLQPKAMEPGERRPVVVCQHGLEGTPEDLIKPGVQGEHYYHRFGADLANHGFVVYCPQNPYLGGDKFRRLLRIANPLKLSLYSFILSQHGRTLDWLCTLPFVDASRIGFYGLSYGGKTAVRVPPLDERYALSICSGDFNQWTWKIARDDAPFNYVLTHEYEMLEFNMGNTFDYSDLSNLMTPRPFMVERGHSDGVSYDSWVAYEYAKVQRHYDKLGLQDRTRIEYFNGPHTIHGVGTFAFLHQFLNWGEPFKP